MLPPAQRAGRYSAERSAAFPALGGKIYLRSGALLALLFWTVWKKQLRLRRLLPRRELLLHAQDQEDAPARGAQALPDGLALSSPVPLQRIRPCFSHRPLRETSGKNRSSQSIYLYG